MNFTGARTKFSIGSLDDASLEIDAQYNPKELQISQANTWTGNGSIGQTKKSALQFTERQSDTTKIELIFDGAENHGRLHPHGGAETVHSAIATLRRLADMQAPASSKSGLKRPHFCVATWGDPAKGMPRFECVIESIAVNYTMFDSNGSVLRATVTLGLKEARRLSDDDADKDTDRRATQAEARANARAEADKKRTAYEATQRIYTREEEERRATGRARLKRADFRPE